MKLHYLTPFSWLGEGDFWSGHLFIEFQSSWFLPVYEFSGDSATYRQSEVEIVAVLRQCEVLANSMCSYWGQTNTSSLAFVSVIAIVQAISRWTCQVRTIY